MERKQDSTLVDHNHLDETLFDLKSFTTILYCICNHRYVWFEKVKGHLTVCCQHGYCLLCIKNSQQNKFTLITLRFIFIFIRVYYNTFRQLHNFNANAPWLEYMDHPSYNISRSRMQNSLENVFLSIKWKYSVIWKRFVLKALVVFPSSWIVLRCCQSQHDWLDLQRLQSSHTLEIIIITTT